MTTNAKHKTIYLSAPDSLSADTVLQADGSLWSHAATLGEFVYRGEKLTLSRDVFDNFERVFATGGENKVPVDYEHGTTNGATGYGQPIPKAGDVVELKGVYSVDDFTGDLKAAAEKLATKAGRSLSDPQNFGLWIRWRPTARALGMIQAREYSELSVSFDHVASRTTGEDQGLTLLAVALTNRPFITDMLPVAASRDAGGTPADTRDHSEENTMTQITLLSALAALIHKPVADDNQAVTELTALQTELPQLREFRSTVAKELNGEIDPAKAAAKIKELAASVARVAEEAKTAKAAAIKTSVEATMKAHEKRLTVPMREIMAAQLTRELEGGAKIDDAPTTKALASMPELGITQRATGADDGTNKDKDPQRVTLSRAEELLKTEELKELAREKGHAVAFNRACDMAEAEALAATN